MPQSVTQNKFLKNLDKLLPFAGFILVLAGILGIVAVQKPLENSQEVRSQASEDDTWPSISVVNPDQVLELDQVNPIYITLDTKELNITNIKTTFNIIANKLKEAPLVTVNLSSGFRADSLEVQEVDDGYLVQIIAVPHNLNVPKTPSFIDLSLTPTTLDPLTINFDEDNTIFTINQATYSAEAITTTLRVADLTPDDEDHQTIKQCNQECSSNSDCGVNYRCFSTNDTKVCRLATNPSSVSCTNTSKTNLKQCNQECGSNADCEQGLTCYQNSCRNPLNPSSATCSKLSSLAADKQSSNCNESCQSNQDCAINYRCLDTNNEKVCRLATNPSSTSCSSTKERTVSIIYDNQPETPAIKKGDNLIPDTQLELNPHETQTVDKSTDANFNKVAKDETVFDLLKKMLKDNNYRLATFTAIVGLILILTAIIIASIKKIKQTKLKKSNKSSQSELKKTKKNSNNPKSLTTQLQPIKIPTPPTVATPTSSKMKDSHHIKLNKQNNLESATNTLVNNKTIKVDHSSQDEKIKKLLKQLNSQTSNNKTSDV